MVEMCWMQGVHAWLVKELQVVTVRPYVYLENIRQWLTEEEVSIPSDKIPLPLAMVLGLLLAYEQTRVCYF